MELISYDGMKIDVSDLIAHLETYAKAVLWRMQKSDKEFKGCWTACVINFNELQPEFNWGSIEDMKRMDGIYVELPLPEPPIKEQE